MSEGAPLCLNRYDGERKLLSVGNPVLETEVEVVDLETGTSRLPMGEAGEVRVRGPQMMTGYHNKPEETAYVLRDGYIYTGDIGYVDRDGFLFLVDRKKEMVIVWRLQRLSARDRRGSVQSPGDSRGGYGRQAR